MRMNHIDVTMGEREESVVFVSRQIRHQQGEMQIKKPSEGREEGPSLHRSTQPVS